MMWLWAKVRAHAIAYLTLSDSSMRFSTCKCSDREPFLASFVVDVEELIPALSSCS